MDRTVLTGSSSPTPVLTIHGINKKSGSLGLKTGFHPDSRFSRSDLSVRSGSENSAHDHYLEHILIISINKIPQLIKQKSNNFYVILQTILCVYYVEEIVFFLYQLNYLSKPKKKDWLKCWKFQVGFTLQTMMHA